MVNLEKVSLYIEGLYEPEVQIPAPMKVVANMGLRLPVRHFVYDNVWWFLRSEFPTYGDV